ncbi:methyltransferase domain-containing protein [Leptospira stimsonii]|uniref:Arsenite methyltransferase n=1 Tax=Leptospira stimsonii TaxID=2202203 RepID=A0ABY2MZB2_9LEPT|nr:methyltransferase domain-containing protein [Leptospira stimsonii]TGK17729.1 methyltransferase domain-containing protein [Leptospira stimsonii]TGM12572.1 methyltransferase domain-containing protein [Leptospira stimsonii]
MNRIANVMENVKEYYGTILKSNRDLKTTACCTADRMPSYLRDILNEIHEEVKDRFYGCGSPIPFALEGNTVLDLGSGSGRDCFLLSKLVGPNGNVIGVDMTEEQVSIAEKHVPFHQERFGYEKTNVRFLNGYIENLNDLGIPDSSVDVVISNCVINLSPLKKEVFSEIFRVLKPGGELFFSDIFSSRRIPIEIAQDPVLYGECLGGAMYIEDFRRLLHQLGNLDFRVTSSTKVDLVDDEIIKRVGQIEFYSMTIRAFKLPLEDKCEDYGQVATYLGGIPNSEDSFLLDDHHLFEKYRPSLVCGNTAMMLEDTRYSSFFKIDGNRSRHFGLFDCAPANNRIEKNTSSASCC